MTDIKKGARVRIITPGSQHAGTIGYVVRYVGADPDMFIVQSKSFILGELPFRRNHLEVLPEAQP